MLNLKDFTVGDGVANDTAGLQSCIAQAISTHDSIHVPVGKYKITSRIDITDSIKISGDGYCSFWGGDLGSLFIFDGCDGFYVSTARPVFFDNFEVKAANNKTGITLTAGANQTNTDSVLRDIRVAGGFYGINVANVSRVNIDHCIVEGCTGASIWINNSNFPDGGDNCISNCTLDGGAAGHLWWGSGGGLRMTGCKINGGTSGIVLSCTNNIPTGILQFSNNSVENITYGFIITRSTSVPKLVNILLSNNEFFTSGNALYIGGVAGNYISNFVATGNILYGKSILGGIINGLVAGNVTSGGITVQPGCGVTLGQNA